MNASHEGEPVCPPTGEKITFLKEGAMSKIRKSGRSIRKIAPLFLVSALVFVFGSMIAHAQDTVVTSTESLVEIQCRFDRPIITTVGNYVSVTMEGLSKIQKAGEPKLPVKHLRILIPFGRRLNALEVIPGREIELEGRYTVEPGQRPIPLSFIGPGEPTPPAPRIYSASNPFPGVLNSDPMTQGKRGFRIIVLSLFPVEYIPSEGRLSYYENMTVKVNTEPAPVPLRRRAFKKADKTYMRKMVDNPQTVDTYPEGVPAETSFPESRLDPADSYQYVIITSETLGDSEFTRLVENKQARGITTTIKTTEWIYQNYEGTRPDGGEDNQTRIRNFIIDAYENWGTEYFLLGGSSDIVPPRLFGATVWPYEAEMPADMYYGCLDGTFDADGDGRYGEPNDGPSGGEVDLYYDVYVGRAAVEDATEVSNFVTKTLAYEDASDEYLHLASMVGEHLDFGGASEYAKNSMEEIRLGSSAHGYTTMGFEDSPSAEFIVTHYEEVGCEGHPPPLYDADGIWPKSALIEFINNGHCGYPGVQILNHLGHADYTYCMKLYNSDLSSLTNDRYFFAYSQGCMPGGFDENDCFAEEITAMEHGAFGVIMNARYGFGTRYSTDGPSQRYNRPFWDGVFNEGLLELGKANAYSKEHFNAVRINDSAMRWCYYEINLFGDPELRLKTDSGGGAVEANFSGSPTSGCAPLDVTFTDNSTGEIDSWYWEFGDGNTSTEENPTHQYSESGTYTVSLTVTGPNGSDTETKTDYITVSGPSPTADFSGSPTSGPGPLTVGFTDLSLNDPTYWSWDFGDGGISEDQNPIHEYGEPGVYTVSLTVTNACGSDIKEKENYITVEPGENRMHVQKVDVTRQSFFWIIARGKALVRIVDASGSPLAGVTVTGKWSGSARDTDTFTTDSDGWGTAYSDWVFSLFGSPDFTFCVSDVIKPDWEYDPDANEETCGSTEG